MNPGKRLEAVVGTGDRVRGAPAHPQRLDEPRDQRGRELVRSGLRVALDHRPRPLELGERGGRVADGGVLGAEVEVQERRRRALGLLGREQLDVAP